MSWIATNSRALRGCPCGVLIRAVHLATGKALVTLASDLGDKNSALAVTPICMSAVTPACRAKRSRSGKSWRIRDLHFALLVVCLALAVVVRRHLGDQEGKLLGHVAADKKLLREIGIAVGIGKNHIDDVARTAQRRGAHFNPGQ